MVDPRVRSASTKLSGWGHPELAAEVDQFGDLLVSKDRFPIIEASLDWADALYRGSALGLQEARRRFDKALAMLSSEALPFGDAPTALSTGDEAAYQAACLLGEDPLLAAEMALDWLERVRAERPDLVVALSTTAALAFRHLHVEGAAGRLAIEGAALGLAMLETESSLSNRSLIAYRCATAIDLLLGQALGGRPDPDFAAVLIERARRTMLPDRPAGPDERQFLDTVWDSSPSDALAEPVTPLGLGDIDLSELAHAATGVHEAWWWGIRLSEGGAWVSSVRPGGRADVDSLPADHVTTIIEEVARQQFFATREEEDFGQRQIEDRFQQALLGTAGRASSDLSKLVPKALQRGDVLANAPIDVAVSLPAAMHYVPLASVQILGEPLLEVVRPTVVGAHSVRACHESTRSTPPSFVFISGPGAAQLVASARPDTAITQTYLDEAIAILGDPSVDIAVLAGHVPSSEGNHDLGQAGQPEAIAHDGLMLRGSQLLTPEVIAGLERVPWCVVLVGCRASGGAVGVTDDRVGLAPAFLRAGARWVISPAWPVHIEESVSFLSCLLTLLEEETPPEALRLTQLHFIDEIRRGHPEVPTHTWLPWACMAATP